uniref:Glucuronosyltransferase n=1 Tax=Panagrolaimus sp. PS1159 TaxID=55785 RepID=A0AC35ES08_9BILA
MLKNAAVRKLKDDIKESLKEKNHEHAFQQTIKLANHFKEGGQYLEAFKEYEIAKSFIKRCPLEKRKEFNYIADKGYIEILFQKGDENEEIQKHLEDFAEKHNDNNFTIKTKQEMCYFLSWSYSYLNNFDKAKLYATKALEFLKDFQVKDAEYEYCKASTYRMLADLSLDEKNYKDANDFCEKALKCKGVQSDPKLYYSLLNIQRHYAKREDRLAISLEMEKLLNGHKNQLKQKKYNTCICLLEDYFIHKNFKKAEEAYLMLYKDPECLKNDIKNEIKSGLVVLYQTEKRMDLINELKLASAIDYKRMALMYERCCQDLRNLSVLEILVQYYETILNICKYIDGDEMYGDLEIFCRTLTDLIEVYYDLGTYNRVLGYEFIGFYEKAFFYGTLLLEAQEKAGVSRSSLIKTRLNQAIKQVYCNTNFEEKKKAFTNVKNFLEDDVQQVKWYTNYITLLENDPENMQTENITELKDKLREYEEKVKGMNIESPGVERIYTDEYDELTEDETLKRVEEKLKTFEKIEKLKNKKRHVNATSGETYLHTAVLNATYGTVDEHIKLLFEKCGYNSIINVPDNIGLTPLHFAVLYSNFEVAEYLLQNHADVNTATVKEFKPNSSNDLVVLSSTTPLMEACSQGNAKMIKLLLQYKADPLMKDIKGNTAIKYLQNALPHVDESRRPELINFLDTVKPLLTSEYEMEMKKGQKGVVFFSFGTNVDTTDLPKSLKHHFFNAIKHFQDYHFIVKFDSRDKDAELESKNIPNCKLVIWAPQPAILAHPKCKLFITHGGYNSLLESVNNAIPLLLMPIFGDQWRNAMLA